MVAEFDPDALAVAHLQVSEVGLVHKLRCASHSYKIWIMADEDHTVFSAADICLYERTYLVAHLERLHRVFRAFNRPTTMSKQLHFVSTH